MALPTNQPIAPYRNTPAMQALNHEQPFHPIYNYAAITDSEEGLILVDVNTFADGNPRNNFLKRAVFADGSTAWNENGVLNGARHIILAGHFAYIAATAGLVVVDLDDPLRPRLAATVPLRDVRASALQFRYLWVTDAEGVQLLDVTRMDRPRLIPEATVRLADARRIYVARTYAYVAAKQDGLVILDVANPERPSLYEKVTFAKLPLVLETLQYLKTTDVWFEVTTLLIPGLNDSDAELAAECAWFAEHLGPDVPLHFSAFHPDFKMRDIPRTPPQTLSRARRIALEHGLKYVYTGNVHDTEGGSTCCPGCGSALIVRDWYRIEAQRVTPDGRCPDCGQTIAGRFETYSGQFGPRRIPIGIHFPP